MTYIKQHKQEIDDDLSVCVDVPKPVITGSHEYKIMTSLPSLGKCPIDSYPGCVLSVQIW